MTVAPMVAAVVIGLLAAAAILVPSLLYFNIRGGGRYQDAMTRERDRHAIVIASQDARYLEMVQALTDLIEVVGSLKVSSDKLHDLLESRLRRVKAS